MKTALAIVITASILCAVILGCVIGLFKLISWASDHPGREKFLLVVGTWAISMLLVLGAYYDMTHGG